MHDYKGKLLIANPIVDEPAHYKSAYVIIDNNESGTIGLCINKPVQSGAMFSTVMHGMGLGFDYNDIPLYFGGFEVSNRVFIIHSNDWGGLTTKELNSEIRFTSDVSILAALSRGEGPEHFRPCIGYTRWAPGQLDLELTNSNVWSVTSASSRLCFHLDDIDIWSSSLVAVTKEQVNHWF